VKNTLATIQAISRMTIRNSHDMAAFEQAFAARLLALSSTHNLQTESAWSGVELRELLTKELEPFRGLFSIRRFKVKRFRAVLPLRCLMSLAGPCFSSGSALWLSHDGIRRMRRSNLLRVLIAQNAIDTSAHANSPHPSSREGRLSTGWRKLVYLSVRATGCSTGPIRRSPRHPPSSSGTRFRRSKGGA
jgi:hypothetical protein